MKSNINKWLEWVGVAALVFAPTGCCVCVGRGACNASATCATKVSQCSKLPFKLIFIRKVQETGNEFACHSSPVAGEPQGPWSFASGQEVPDMMGMPLVDGTSPAMLPAPVMAPVDPNCPTCNGDRVSLSHPSPPPRSEQKEKPEPAEPAPAAPKAEVEPLPMPPVPSMEEDLTGSLTLSVLADKGIAAEGDLVQFEINIRNQGTGAIPTVNLQAVLSDNVTIEYVLPASSGRINGNRVTFEPISNFQPMELEYSIGVRIRDMASENARITVEAQSPILRGGPLKEEATVRLPPNG